MGKKTFFITILFMLGVLMGASAYPDVVLFKKYAQQAPFCDSLYSNTIEQLDSATALAKLIDLEQWADRKGDIQLQYYFRILRDRYRLNKLDVDKEKVINECLDFDEELEKSNMPLLRADVISMIAMQYWNDKKYALAFEHAINAYNIYSHYTFNEFPKRNKYLFDLASMYFHFRDFAMAKKYLLESVHTVPVTQNGIYTTTLNTLALSYRSMDMHDSAAYYFTLAYNMAVSRNDTLWSGILGGNLGYVYYLQKQVDKAMPWLENDVRVSLENNRDLANAANSMAVISDIYLQRGDIAKAFDEAMQAYKIMTTHDFKGFKLRKNISLSLARASAANRDYRMAYLLLDSATMAGDSLARNANILVLAGVQHKMDADKYLQDAMKLEREKRLSTWIRNGVIAGCIMLVIIAVLFINRQRLKAAQQQQLARAEIEDAARQLAGFTRMISDKNELIENFAAELRRIKAQHNIDNSQETELFSRLQQATILDDAQWKNFQHLFSGVHKDFLKRLAKKVPGLSPVEMKFILLSKLRLSAKEMSAVLGISTDAVKLNVQRLSDKLNLGEGENRLEDFVDTI